MHCIYYLIYRQEIKRKSYIKNSSKLELYPDSEIKKLSAKNSHLTKISHTISNNIKRISDKKLPVVRTKKRSILEEKYNSIIRFSRYKQNNSAMQPNRGKSLEHYSTKTKKTEHLPSM